MGKVVAFPPRRLRVPRTVAVPRGAGAEIHILPVVRIERVCDLEAVARVLPAAAAERGRTDLRTHLR